jgi:hypothetical protein
VLKCLLESLDRKEVACGATAETGEAELEAEEGRRPVLAGCALRNLGCTATGNSQTCYGGSMFYARREPFRTNLDQAPDYPKSYSSCPWQGGQRPDPARPHKVATVTRSWHSLPENYPPSAWQPRATFNLCSRKPGCDSSRSRRYEIVRGAIFLDNCSRHNNVPTLDSYATTNTPPVEAGRN